MGTTAAATNKLVDKVSRLAGKQHDDQASTQAKPTRSLKIAQQGLRTGFDTINLLTATITDVLEEGITTNQANVVVNAVGKVLKVVELQFKYGKPRPDGGRSDRDLVLVGGSMVTE